MREVSACDFCGGEAAGTFEVLPPEVDGGRRMLLCPGCRDTLGTVLEPLLDGRDDAPPEATGGGDDPPDDTAPAGDGRDGESTPGSAASDAGDDGTAAGGADAADATEGDDTGSAAEGDAADGGAPTTAAGEDAPPPHGYRKVVRFLQNREFPIDRDHAVSMVSDAYGLEPGAVEAAIDHAVAEGRFAESGGQLTAP